MSTWLAENPEMLQAALEIVDTWDEGYLLSSPQTTRSGDSSDDGQESITSNSNSSNYMESPTRLPSLVVKPSKIQASKNRRLKPSTMASTHHRRRDEILSLRAKFIELERRLAALQTQQRLSKTLPSDSDAAPQTSMWRDIARCQKQLRSFAEAKQMSLRRRAEEQVKLGRGLVRLLRKAQNMANHEMMPSMEPPKLRLFGEVEISEFEQLSRIEDTYETIDHVFTGPQFQHGNIGSMFSDLQLLDDYPDQIVIEVTSVWTAPFDVDRTMDAVWQFIYMRQQHKWCAPDFVQNSKLRLDDTKLVAEFTAVATVGSETGQFDGRAVFKRFPTTTASPSVVVSDFYCAPSRTDPGAFTGVRTEEQSCLRVFPLLPSKDKKGMWQGSRVESSQRFTIAFEDSGSGRHHAGLFANLMLRKLRDSTSMMQETVESILLQS